MIWWQDTILLKYSWYFVVFAKYTHVSDKAVAIKTVHSWRVRDKSCFRFILFFLQRKHKEGIPIYGKQWCDIWCFSFKDIQTILITTGLICRRRHCAWSPERNVYNSKESLTFSQKNLDLKKGPDLQIHNLPIPPPCSLVKLQILHLKNILVSSLLFLTVFLDSNALCKMLLQIF